MKFIHSFFFILLTLAAFLLPKNLVIAVPFKDTIYAANAAFNKQDFSQATDLFIKGYWELRKTLTDIWYKADPIGFQGWGPFREAFNGKYVPLQMGRYESPRGYTQISNILLGCWLNNSLLRQEVNWLGPICKGYKGSYIYHQGKSKSNIIKKKFVATFESKNICCIRDAGNWLQFSFCKPVSQLLLKRFESSPENAHDLLQILELYKCYIECDGGDIGQLCFAQANYDIVYRKFYKWFKTLIIQQLTSFDNPIQTVLISIFHHCDEKMPNAFFDDTSLKQEKIRSLGGYQIEIGTILKSILDPNNGQIRIDKDKPKAASLCLALGSASEKYKEMVQTCKKNQIEMAAVVASWNREWYY